MEIMLPFALACAASDLRTKRIPNTLILCGLIGAVISRFFLTGWLTGQVPERTGIIPIKEVADSLAGFLLPWLFLGPPAALKMIGGGDVKMLSVLGLWLGTRRCLPVLWHSLLIAAVWSVILVVHRRNLMQRLRYLELYVGHAVNTGKLSSYRTGTGKVTGTGSAAETEGLPGSGDASGEFCFAVPILLAFLCASCR